MTTVSVWVIVYALRALESGFAPAPKDLTFSSFEKCEEYRKTEYKRMKEYIQRFRWTRDNQPEEFYQATCEKAEIVK